MTQEKLTPEAIAHLAIHFFGVVALFWIVLALPLWLSLTLIALEVWQIKHFGNCFLTVFAHKRGYMKGMSYWQYVPHLLGVKDYKRADHYISSAIKLGLVGILLLRAGSAVFAWI